MIDIANLYEQSRELDTFVKVLDHYNLFTGETRYKVICPFHEDINASLLIDVSEIRWFCFGCQKGGGAFELVQSFESNKSAIEQWQTLYRITNNSAIKTSIKYKKQSQVQLQQESHKQLIRAQDFYYNLRTIDWINEDFPEKDYLVQRGFKPSTLNKVGAKLTYNESYPIVFPMRDMGRFSGWVCRTTDPKIEAKRKYLYNKGFSRRNTLVGRYDNKKVVIVEGMMDYLKAKQLGIKYVCALLGWKATSEQIDKLNKQGVTTIISALDKDDCGTMGTKHLRQFFRVVRFQYPSGVKDMGDMTPQLFKEAKKQTMRRM